VPLQPRAVLPVAWHAPGRRVGRAPTPSHPPSLAQPWCAASVRCTELLRLRATGLLKRCTARFGQACRAALDVQPTHTCEPPTLQSVSPVAGRCKWKRSLTVGVRLWSGEQQVTLPAGAHAQAHATAGQGTFLASRSAAMTSGMDARRTHCALEVTVRGGASRPRQSSAGCCGTSRTTWRLSSCCKRVCRACSGAKSCGLSLSSNRG
jgi:hypothetical protein